MDAVQWAVPGYAHVPFFINFSWAFVRMDAVDVPAKFEVHSFTRSWDNSDWSFGWGLRTPNLGEEEAVRGDLFPEQFFYTIIM